MFELLPFVLLEDHAGNILNMIFQRLTRAKTTKFVRCSLVFFWTVCRKSWAEHLVKFVESIQNGLFGMIVDSLILKESQKITGVFEKKIYSVGLIKILVYCPSFHAKYSVKWPQVLEVLIALFELPTDQSEVEGSGDHFIDLTDNEGGYQNSYSQLVFGADHATDPFESQISDVKIYLAQSLHKFSLQNPQQVNSHIAAMNPQAQQHLQTYYRSAGVST